MGLYADFSHQDLGLSSLMTNGGHFNGHTSFHSRIGRFLGDPWPIEELRRGVTAESLLMLRFVLLEMGVSIIVQHLVSEEWFYQKF